jgi:hypothetical protein
LIPAESIVQGTSQFGTFGADAALGGPAAGAGSEVVVESEADGAALAALDGTG